MKALNCTIAAAYFLLAQHAFLSPALAERWYAYEECKHLDKLYFDGDSFHVRTKSNHYIFRLYFVDAPELEKTVPERVAEQAEYWDISEEQVIELARKAKAFTKKFLSKGFTVHSRREDAKGRSHRPRFFGFVEADGQYLSEELVKNGLARVYGAWAKLPDGTRASKFRARLKIIERQAKREKRGGWGMPSVTQSSHAAAGISKTNLVLKSALDVYSAKGRRLYLGAIPRGHEIEVLAPETRLYVRVRFVYKGKTNEVLCSRRVLKTHYPYRKK